MVLLYLLSVNTKMKTIERRKEGRKTPVRDSMEKIRKITDALQIIQRYCWCNSYILKMTSMNQCLVCSRKNNILHLIITANYMSQLPSGRSTSTRKMASRPDVDLYVPRKKTKKGWPFDRARTILCITTTAYYRTHSNGKCSIGPYDVTQNTPSQIIFPVVPWWWCEVHLFSEKNRIESSGKIVGKGLLLF